jgi:hypothetical protein
MENLRGGGIPIRYIGFKQLVEGGPLTQFGLASSEDVHTYYEFSELELLKEVTAFFLSIPICPCAYFTRGKNVGGTVGRHWWMRESQSWKTLS